MINILVAPTDHYACDLYRCSGPHKKLQEMFPNEFNVIIDYGVNWKLLTYNNPYDIIYLHNGFYNDTLFNCIEILKKQSIVILDVDDYWELPKENPRYKSLKESNYSNFYLHLVHLSNYIVTTQKYIADILKSYNPNVIIFPNTLNLNTSISKTKSNRIRFGLTGSTIHSLDYQLLANLPYQLDDCLDRIQIVLCGFQKTFSYYKKGYCYYKASSVSDDNIWWQYEKLLTGNYRICSDEYKTELLKFKDIDTIVDEPYQRILGKPIDTYIEFYNNIDVLLAPLQNNIFNNCKSELKIIEAGLTDTAIILSDIEPYKVCTSILNSDNSINVEGNCLFASNSNEWVLSIKKLIDNSELIELSKRNLKDFVQKNYDINYWTIKRANWYKNILNSEQTYKKNLIWRK